MFDLLKRGVRGREENEKGDGECWGSGDVGLVFRFVGEYL